MIITNTGSKLEMKLIRDWLIDLANSNQLWLAVGSGDSTWDANGIPTPQSSQTQLVNEVYRVKVNPSDIQYITTSSTDPENDVISTDTTNTLRVLGIINFPQTAFREYGLFVEGTSTANSGSLYIYGTHTKIILGQLNVYMKYIYINK